MAPLSLLELCWDCLAETEQTFFVLAALAYEKNTGNTNEVRRKQGLKQKM